MTERARRRLTLDMEHERAIHALCTQADAAVYALRHGSEQERLRSAAALESAWKTVSHKVMP